MSGMDEYLNGMSAEDIIGELDAEIELLKQEKTLRDEYATAIAQGYSVMPEGGNITDWDAWAKDVFKGADAMLKAR